ncbi:MAG: OmpH family outer membrane protein [Gammaproteobacteria bacterium]
MINSSKIKLVTVLLLMLTAVGVSAAELKIGVVDVEKVLPEQLEKINKELTESFIEPRQEKILAARQKVQDLVAKLQTEAVTMSVSERQVLEDEIRALDREAPRLQQDLQDDVNRRQQQLLEDYNMILQDKIAAFAEKEGYDLILQKNVTLYDSQALDITDKVLAALSAE